MRTRTIKFQGLDIKMNIDINDIVKKTSSKYKPKIDGYKKLVAKRNEYIHNMHQKMKDKEIGVYLIYDALRIMKKAKDAYDVDIRQLLTLSYLHGISMLRKDHINKYLIAIGCKPVTRIFLKKLVEYGYIMDAHKYAYYSITDKGRKIVDNIFLAFRQDYAFYEKNKPMKREYHTSQPAGTKYSDEEKEKRSILYRKMMTPFWDGGYKVVPKSRKMRVDYLVNWIDKRKRSGLMVDEYYYNLIEKWSQ